MVKAIIILSIPIILVAAIFIDGQTFGQRCKDAGLSGLEFERCVYDLKQGRRP